MLYFSSRAYGVAVGLCHPTVGRLLLQRENGHLNSEWPLASEFLSVDHIVYVP